MGLLSSSVSITRYRVEGKIQPPILENIARALSDNVIRDIDDDVAEKAVGWTSLDKPYQPDFRGSSFVFGNFLAFCLRIDKKNIPAKTLRKHYMIEMSRRLAKSGRDFLSRNEKKLIKDHVTQVLNTRMPATPAVYDLLWNYEESGLWFFSNLKTANEELETLFSRSFNLTLIRLFPYTSADIASQLSDSQRDDLRSLTPSLFGS